MQNDILQSIAEQEGLKLSNSHRLSGGSINAVYRLETEQGSMIVKVNTKDQYPQMFAKEARGLQLLKKTNSFKIPEVYGQGKIGDNAYLLIEYLSVRDDKTGSWESFARALAELHKNSKDTFGLDHDNYIGSLPQYNNSNLTNAGEFYIEKRLKPQYEIAREKNGFSFGRLDKMFEHIKYFIPDEPPALVHGDLWNGNYMLTANAEPALIDPAVAYAPREMDLAMMKLFGGFPDEAFAAYNEIFPLDKAWKERIDIFQLYYLLVHLNLFGQNYFHPINGIMQRFR